MTRRKPPSFAAVQRLLREMIAAMPVGRRYKLTHRDPTEQTSARRELSDRFARALRKRGWLAAEGYAK